MQTPTSGTSEPNLAENLGDTSKLDFLNSIPLEAEVSSPPPQAAEGAASNAGAASDVSSTPNHVESTAPAPAPDSASTEPAPAELAQLDLSEPAPITKPNGQGIIPAGKVVRDYSDIKPEHVEVFKQMSDKAYQEAKAWYRQAQSQPDVSKYETELRELRDYRFYQHPEAYRLAPEYQTAAKQYRNESQVINHYKAQLAAIRQGNPIRDIGYDANGNLTVLPTELPPSPELEAEVTAALQAAIVRQQSATQALEGLSTRFTEQSKAFDSKLDQAVNALVTPELLQSKDFESAYNMYLTKVVPPHLQNVPVYRQLAKQGAFIQMAVKALRGLQEQLKVNSVKVNTVRNQGPADGNPTSRGAGGDIGSLPASEVLNEFERMRAGY